ncbi:hypothetical protein TcCL_NonESM10313 [Trypanosoma cruzi]|nr:hypothetical protein TcCL_NonESM10313 [Trypanosoma cruzi]
MDDGTPRLANTLPRRKKATFALRKADWPAFTSLCETLLATASTWLDSRGGILRAAERHIPRGSRDSSKKIWTHEMEQAESAAEAANKAHIAFPGKVLYFTECTRKKGGTKSSLTPLLRYASGSPCGKTWSLTQPELARSSRRGGAAPSSFGIGCAPH